jgi:hypothetical protein
MFSSLETIWNNRLTPNEKKTFSIPSTEIVSTGFLTHGNYCGPGSKDLPAIDALDQACMFHDYYYGSEFSDEKFILTLKLLCMNGLIQNRLVVNIICNWSGMLRLMLKARRLVPGVTTNIEMKRR